MEFLGNKLIILYFYVFGYRAYMFLSSEVCANKLVSCSKLIIFIGYKNNSYCFICYIQENIIFTSYMLSLMRSFFLLTKKSNFIKHYTILSKLAYLGSRL